MPKEASIHVESPQSNVNQIKSPQITPLANPIPRNNTSSTSDNMADAKEIDYSTLGKVLADTITSANELPAEKVKSFQAKIYNLFSGADKRSVDFMVAVYFIRNDPSARADWSKAHPLVLDGRTVAISKIIGPEGFISVSKNDGELRRFLASGYSHLIQIAIDNVPGLAEELKSRAAQAGLSGVSPSVAVSWARNGKVGSPADEAARALYRKLANRTPAEAAQVTPLVSEPPPTPAQGGGGSRQTYF